MLTTKIISKKKAKKLAQRKKLQAVVRYDIMAEDNDAVETASIVVASGPNVVENGTTLGGPESHMF